MHKNTALLYCLLCSIICLGWETMLVAQTQDTLPNNLKLDNSLLFEPSETQKQDAVDVIDFIKKLTKIQTKSRSEQGKVHLSAFPAVGYSLQTGFAGLVDANVVFKSKKPQDNEKVSFLYSSLAYTEYKQVIFPFRASIWLGHGKYNLQSDWRFVKYPSETFGLGGHTHLTDGYSIDFDYLKFHQTVVTQVSKNLYAGLGYYLDYLWKTDEVGTPSKNPSDFQLYGLNKTATASGFVFQLLQDSRKNPINPDNGWYSKMVLRPNLSFLGAGTNWTSVQLEFRKYFRFPGKSRNVLAFWNYNWFMLGKGKAPYLLLPSTGWDDNFNTGRGYIQGRFRGNSMVYLEGEYRFKITPKGFLGGVVFANAQSFSQTPEHQFEVLAPAFGAGLRIKLNKFSGANLCIDYGIGLQGSNGISVNIGEIF